MHVEIVYIIDDLRIDWNITYKIILLVTLFLKKKKMVVFRDLMSNSKGIGKVNYNIYSKKSSICC